VRLRLEAAARGRRGIRQQHSSNSRLMDLGLGGPRVRVGMRSTQGLGAPWRKPLAQEGARVAVKRAPPGPRGAAAQQLSSEAAQPVDAVRGRRGRARAGRRPGGAGAPRDGSSRVLSATRAVARRPCHRSDRAVIPAGGGASSVHRQSRARTAGAHHCGRSSGAGSSASRRSPQETLARAHSFHHGAPGCWGSRKALATRSQPRNHQSTAYARLHRRSGITELTENRARARRT